MKPSPAPVVSTAWTLKVGTSFWAVRVNQVEPALPRLSVTQPQPVVPEARGLRRDRGCRS